MPRTEAECSLYCFQTTTGSDDAEEEENKTYVDSSDDEQSLRPSEITRHKRKRTGEQSTSCPPKRSTFIAKFRRAFENCWIRLLKCRIPRTLFQTLLLEIPTKVLPFLQHPLMLSDLFTDAYRTGGYVGMLALEALFVLVTQHGLDYPDLYPSLYGMLTPQIFLVPYRHRFFKLVDTFLRSTHVQTYLVASFAKRLARLALTAPSGAAAFVIALIFNLLNTHRACRILLNRSDSLDPVGSDPFDMNELDLSKTGALESSLWELESLRQHVCPSIASLCGLFKRHMGDISFKCKMQDYLDLDLTQLFEQECNRLKRAKAVAMNFTRTEFTDVDKGSELCEL